MNQDIIFNPPIIIKNMSMKKEVKISFSFVKHEYLVRFFGEDGRLEDWKIVIDSKEISPLISKFYFPLK